MCIRDRELSRMRTLDAQRADQLRLMSQDLSDHLTKSLHNFTQNYLGIFEPLLNDAKRVKRLVGLVSELAGRNAALDLATQEIQTLINENGPLTARQLLYLVMESGGIDVHAALRREVEALKPMAEIGKRVYDGGMKGQE